jgi:Mor family transcriptional regulator
MDYKERLDDFRKRDLEIYRKYQRGGKSNTKSALARFYNVSRQRMSQIIKNTEKKNKQKLLNDSILK